MVFLTLNCITSFGTYRADKAVALSPGILSLGPIKISLGMMCIKFLKVSSWLP